MSNFKVGQKVVYIGGCKQPMMVVPQINEVVEIKSICIDFSDSYDIFGYERAKDGFLQSFHSNQLRALDHQFAEEVIAMITELELQEA